MAGLQPALSKSCRVRNMKITIDTDIAAPIDAVWRAFNDPHDILQWDASADWHTTRATNDLRVGGRLELRIDAKDGGSGFDFVATYTRVEPQRLIEWRVDDDHHVRVEFIENSTGVTVRQTFDADATASVEDQRQDWQGVLDSFAQHATATQNR